MIVGNTTQTYVETGSASSATGQGIDPGGEAASTNAPAALVENNTASGSPVSISGEALVLSRLFMTSDPGAAPMYTVLDKSDSAVSPYDFLTEGDRDLLANVYTYAQQQGVDLRYVDMLALDLGTYRKYGQVQSSSNVGIYNLNGQKETFSFTAQDTATANAILNGSAMASTQFDSGFLQYELNPGFSFDHVANFAFLQQVVEHFSGAGGGQNQPLAQQFGSFLPNGQNNFVVATASAVTLPPSEPDDMNINGVPVITAKGIRNGYTIQNGVPVKTGSGPANGAFGSSFFANFKDQLYSRVFTLLDWPSKSRDQSG